MRSAFVHLFNDLASDTRVKDRKDFVLKRANIVLADLKERLIDMKKKPKRVANKYIKRLTFLLKHNRIHYNDDAGSDESLLIQKIDYDILHETKHTLIQSTGHPGNYDAEINLIGYFNPKGKYE